MVFLSVLRQESRNIQIERLCETQSQDYRDDDPPPVSSAFIQQEFDATARHIHRAVLRALEQRISWNRSNQIHVL